MSAAALRGLVALRMDDPGASASVQLDGWSYEKLEPARWEEVGDILERERARLTIGYTPGWVDDGDPGRGELLVGGEPAERVPGRVHPSSSVLYAGRSAPSADCAAEFVAVRALAARGVAAIELHGYTHVHPDRERWARSPTAHTKVGWYRELGPEVTGSLEALPAAARPLRLGFELFREQFGAPPTALLCPGNACGDTVVAEAFELGLESIAARCVALRAGAGFRWRPEIEDRPLVHPATEALAGGAPLIASFHDRDLALHGPRWLAERLAEWRAAGARRFVDLAALAELAGAAPGYGAAADGERSGSPPRAGNYT